MVVNESEGKAWTRGDGEVGQTSDDSFTTKEIPSYLGVIKSYRLQKIVESFSGGEKPNALFAGHVHKYVQISERNIYATSVGCLERQTSWMRGKRLSAHVGFCIVDIWVNKTGICKMSTTWYPFYT